MDPAAGTHPDRASDPREGRVQPVVLGGDIGAYSLARAFHQAYGVRSVVLSSAATGPVRHSRILDNVVAPGMDDDATAVATLRRVAGAHAGARLLLLGSADRAVRTIVENRAQLEDLYAVPYVDRQKLDLLTDKESFGRLCAELGIASPRTVVHDVAAGREPDTSGLTFPVIAKAASTTEYARVSFPGKQKVFTVGSRTELADLMETLRRAGYRGTFLVQDLIPGDDSGMRILTCYSDRGGRVRFSAFGRVLLEEHTPGARGNPAGIITARDEQVVEQARRLLEHVGWTGYANFDLKHDPRDGRTVFFELNPRLGRSNFYVTAGGQNPVELYVREYLDGTDPVPPGAPTENPQDDDEHLYTVLPHRLLLRYVADPALREHVRSLMRSGRVSNPLLYRADRDPRRLAYVGAALVNQYRKYREHYPVPEPRGEAAGAPQVAE